MATWAELERADPDLAAFGRERFEGCVVFHATLMSDGAPRLHPVSPWLATGLLLVSFRAKSPKVAEILGDGRYAMHSVQPAEDHEGTAGEFLVLGWMEQVSEHHPGVVQRPYSASYPLASFACSIDEAVSTTYPDGGSPVYRRWRP